MQVVRFPFEVAPDIFAPQTAVLETSDGKRFQLFLWCFLERRLGTCSEFNVESMSRARVEALPKVLERISKWLRFTAARPKAVHGHLKALSQFLLWADRPEHQGRFETVLADPELAREAIRLHHTFLRQLLQGHQIKPNTAAIRDQGAIQVLSEIYDRVYLEDIEPLSDRRTGGTRAPSDEDVSRWMSAVQAVFDSSTRLLFGQRREPRSIKFSATDDTAARVLPANYSDERLLELACVAFAALAIGDSGANLSQIQLYEEPDDLRAQLENPGRVNLTQRIVKFRAGGKSVPVHLTATTLTRLETYLRVRKSLLDAVGGPQPPALFVQCAYGPPKGRYGSAEPESIRPLADSFLQSLRDKLGAVGVELPPVTLRQLRAFKQQHIVRKHGVRVAAETLGHSIKTAVTAYCNAQEDVRRSDMGTFLSSLSSVVIHAREARDSARTSVPAGACESHGRPISMSEPLIAPDCANAEGCFFCQQFRVHADVQDITKLMSCRSVMQRLAPLQRDSAKADRVYAAVKDRVDALLTDLRAQVPEFYEQARTQVEERGELSRYWATKLQQLHLLGVLK